MKGLKYQFKNIRRDKLCMLSFLLPVIVGIAIHMLSGVSFSSLSETAFCIIENDLSIDTVQWLQTNGAVTVSEDLASLKDVINDPATQTIGVLRDQNGIRTLRSGDELQMNTAIANTLPQLYDQRNRIKNFNINVIPTAGNNDSLTSLLIAITMITAMFMGCTFNAMSIIGEKEDGIALINEILPMTKKEYIIQKLTLGFVGAVISTILTAFVCIRVTIHQIPPLLLMIILSAFVAALFGLLIGRLSSGLMSGIIYIKLIMILFLALPILVYITGPPNSILYTLSYLLPSSAAFYGLMDLLSGTTSGILLHILILAAHCTAWLLLYFALEHIIHKKSSA